jgi:hypothetical protein
VTLEPFGDHEVVECALKIVNTGDGLSESLDVAPVELDHGQVVHVVLRGVVTKVTYEQVKDSDELRRVHTVRANFGTIVDERAAKKVLAGARRSIEQAHGVHPLPGTTDDE